MKILMQTVVAAVLIAGPAIAELDVSQADACFRAAVADQSDPAACIDTAHLPCMAGSAETPAVATLCLTQAQAAWSGALGSRIQSTLAEMDDKIAAVARIEIKYDLLSSLIQCDRLEELSIAASDLTGPEIAMQKARCMSAASGLTYMRLFLRDQP